MKEKSFKVYIFRLLKTLQQPNTYHITRQAVEAVDSILRALAEQIVDRALLITASDDKKTISVSELETAIMMFSSSQLPLGISQARMAVQKFEESEKQRNDSETPIEKSQTRESRCGLIFSVSATEKYIRRFGQVGYNVSSSSPVFLAGFLQANAEEILNEAIKFTVDSDRITINVRHLFLAVSKSECLSSLATRLKVVFLEGGVEPQNLQIKKHPRKKRNSNIPSSSDKGHRWRPGTKTVMDIRRLQKDGEMLIQHAPFNRLVRKIVEKNFSQGNEMRYSADFFTTLQAFVEDRLVSLMMKANKIALHSERETVYAKDILLVRSLEGNVPAPLFGEEEVELPEASIRQLALRAGIRRYGECCTVAYRNFIVDTLNKYLYDMVLCANHNKVQTLNTKLFVEVLSIHGICATVTPHRRKGVRKGKKLRTASQGSEEVESIVGDELEKEIEASLAKDVAELSDIGEEENEA